LRLFAWKSPFRGQNGNGAFAIAETTDREFPVDFLFYFLQFLLDFASIRAIRRLNS